MTRKYNANHLSADDRYQIQETSWYEIKILLEKDDSIDTPVEDLTFVVQSVTLPEISNPAIDVGYGNSTAKLPGKREHGESSFTFMDAMTIDVEAVILGWQNKVYDPETGKMGWVSEFKRTIQITQYGPDGSNERVWILRGCWPSNVAYGEMSGESSDKKNITVTITYDNAYRKRFKDGGLIGNKHKDYRAVNTN